MTSAASLQPSTSQSKAWTPEEKASFRRKNHANIEAMTGRILHRLGYSSRHRDFIAAVQSAHGAGEDAKVPYTEFHRSRACLAEYLGLNGKQESNEVTVSRHIKWHRAWQDRSGIILIEVIPPRQQ